VPFFFAPYRLIGTVCGSAGTGWACDRPSIGGVAEGAFAGGEAISTSNPKATLPPPRATCNSISNFSQCGEKRTFLVLRCARYCMLPKHRERTSLYLKVRSLVLHVLDFL